MRLRDKSVPDSKALTHKQVAGCRYAGNFNECESAPTDKKRARAFIFYSCGLSGRVGGCDQHTNTKDIAGQSARARCMGASTQTSSSSSSSSCFSSSFSGSFMPATWCGYKIINSILTQQLLAKTVALTFGLNDWFCPIYRKQRNVQSKKQNVKRIQTKQKNTCLAYVQSTWKSPVGTHVPRRPSCWSRSLFISVLHQFTLKEKSILPPGES